MLVYIIILIKPYYKITLGPRTDNICNNNSGKRLFIHSLNKYLLNTLFTSKLLQAVNKSMFIQYQPLCKDCVHIIFRSIY